MLIAGATALVSGLILLAGVEAPASIVAGFIPATVSETVAPPPGLLLLPVWITPLSATLVHGGALHLAVNLLLLVYCGRMLERAIGPRLSVLLYLVGAYAAAAGQWALGPHVAAPTIGASGAISAFVGAYSILFAEQPVPRIGPFPPRVVRIAWLAAAWIGLQLLIGFASATTGQLLATGAHVGGFLVGLVLARPFLLWRYRRA